MKIFALRLTSIINISAACLITRHTPFVEFHSIINTE